MLMEPYGSCKEKQKLCPVWNKGGKSGDKLPDARTLSRIKHRIMAEHVAVELAVGRVGWTRLVQPYLTLLRTIEPLAVKQKIKIQRLCPQPSGSSLFSVELTLPPLDFPRFS